MSFSLEQFFAALHLRVATILDLEPSRALSGVRSEPMLGHNALKIHLAHTLKQRRTQLLYVASVPYPRFRNPCHEMPEFLLAVG